MTRIIGFIVLLFVIILGLFFGNINAETVILNYYWGSFQMPFSLALVLALLCGAIMGMLVSLAVIIRLRHQLGKLRKEARISEQEIANLRALPLKDNH